MTIGVGIIGLSASKGAWAGVHFVALSSLPNQYKLVALSTSSPESAAAAGKAYGVPADKCYSSAEALAKDPNVNLVVVSVKVPAHKDLALVAIAAGKDIYVEWPLGVSLKEAEELLAAAKAKGVKTIVSLQGRNNPGLFKLKEIVKSGALGRIFSTNFVGTSNFFATLHERSEYVADVANGVSVITVAGGHNLDTITNILGEFKYLQATTAINFPEVPVADADEKVIRKVKPTSPDSLTVSGVLESGATVTWNVITTTANNPDSLLWYIHGEKGTLKLEGSAAFLNVSGPKITWFKEGKWEDVETPAVTPIDPITAIYKAFAEGKTDEYVGFEEATLRHRLLEAIVKSARDGTRESYL